MKRKIVFLPYDMDTAIGINNEGALVFSYNLEDIDHLPSGADIFNGQQSVLWQNMRAAFFPELRRMYQDLRAQGKLSYPVVEKAFEDHQSKWPEAIFNEDAYFKYLQPLIDDGDASYLSMLQGSKAEQRKWWLYNRFRYIDSKYNAGDAQSDVITLRGYAKSNVVVTPYADVYATVKYGSYLVQTRAARGNAYTLVCPLDEVNDTEIYIYSASQLASVGDLSGFKVGYANFSMATKLQSLKLGDSSASYTNGNLTELYLGNNTLLKVLDVRNCTALGTGEVMQAVDISGCTNIEDVYFDGTSITGLTLPNGGVLKKLHVPATMTNLTIRNQPGITEFVFPDASNLTTLRLENVSSAINTLSLVNALSAGARVRLIGIDVTVVGYNEAAAFYDKLDTMRGLDEQGGNVDKAQVSGVIHLGSITGAQLASLTERYPNVTIDYEHIVSNLYYYNDTTLLYTEEVQDGGDGAWAGTATKPSTAQYTYSFVGWALTNGATEANPNATKGITADRNVYAAFSQTLRTYTVTFARNSADGGGTLQTVNNVPYGGSATYTGTTPTTTKGDATSYPFEGWSPQPTNIQGDMTCYAVFGSPIEDIEITDSWDAIISAIENGSYATKYKVGNYKPLDLGTEGTVNMQIVGMNVDPLASGNGTAPLTFISKELLASPHRMNPSRATDPEDSSKYKEGTGTIGGWEKTEMRSYLKDTIKPLIPEAVRNAIVSVTKYSRIYDTSNTAVNNVESSEDVWVPSAREVGFTGYETSGPTYTTVFADNASRVKTNVSSGSAALWWLRSAYATSSFRCVNSDGSNYDYGASISGGVALGFCLGVPEIADSWSDIFAAEDNGTYSTKYAVGDMKSLTINDHTYMMQIVAMDSDVKSDGTGNAKITWLCKNFWVTHNMNSTSTTAGGWKDSEMRSWLRETVYPMIPSEVRNRIVAVDKTYKDYDNGVLTVSDTVWIPSNREIFGGTAYEDSGVVYSSVFISAARRIKYNMSLGSAGYWWLRSAYSGSNFRYVNDNGDSNRLSAAYAYGVALGFCT